MTNTCYGVSPSEGSLISHNAVDSPLGNASRQMAFSSTCRNSRGYGQHVSEPSTRIAKPKSASNSPRDSMGLVRRRSLMTDGSSRRRVVMADQRVMNGGVPNDGLRISMKSNRPMSWHPTSHFAPSQQPNFHMQNINQYNWWPNFEPSPSSAAYSGHTSPASTFSPDSLPYNEYHPQQDPNLVIPYSNMYCPPNHYSTHTPNSGSTSDLEQPLYPAQTQWNHFIANGFDGTSPPTPDNLFPLQHPEPTFAAEETIPYHPLVEDDEAGEELIGMGLYDNVTKPFPNTPFDLYQTLMTPQSLRHTNTITEPTGKCLKLEETWNPPANDEEDDGDDGNGEIDGDEEEVKQGETAVAQAHNNHQQNPYFPQTNIYPIYHSNQGVQPYLNRYC